MSDKPASETPTEKLRDTILSEREKGNVVFQALPGEFAIAPIDEFVGQPADGILYDLNRGEEISLTFLKDQKWVNDFAVALVIRKLKEKLQSAEQALALERAARERAEACIRDFAAIAKLHDKADATITIRQGLKVWTGKHADAINQALAQEGGKS